MLFLATEGVRPLDPRVLVSDGDRNRQAIATIRGAGTKVLRWDSTGSTQCSLFLDACLTY